LTKTAFAVSAFQASSVSLISCIHYNYPVSLYRERIANIIVVKVIVIKMAGLIAMFNIAHHIRMREGRIAGTKGSSDHGDKKELFHVVMF
jgi:hypothetical protein